MRRSPIGRSSTIDQLAAWLSVDGPRVAALTGEGGIGKTTVADALLDLAADDGWAVLRLTCTHADAALPLGGYADLVRAAEDLLPHVLDDLPPPQRYAAEVALQRRSPDGPPVEPLALALGLHVVLARLVAERRVLICLDDLTWLDSDSAAALAHAVRRLPADRLRVVATVRDRREAPVLGDLHRDDVREVPIGPLPADPLAAVVAEALGWEPTEAVLRGLADAARGNPLFAIELARGLGSSRPVLPPARWEATAGAEDVFGPRLARLPAAGLDAVLAVAMAGAVPAQLVCTVAGSGGLEEAAHRGLLEVRGGQVGVTHPLISAVALVQADPGRRAAVARALTAAVEDPLVALRIRTAAAITPDAGLAAELDRASDALAARGAVTAAADLAREACRLTPTEDAGRAVRLVRTGRLDLASGHPEAVVERLTREWEALGTGDLRADAHLLIGMASPPAEDLARLDLALAEVESDAPRARILLRKALLLAVGEASDITTAAALVAEAEGLPEGLGDAADRASAATIGGWVDVLSGRGCSRAVHPEPSGEMVHEISLRRPLAVLRAGRGDIDTARRQWETLRAEATEGGQAVSALVFAAHLFELAIRVGDVRDAERWLVEFADLPDSEEPERVRRRFLADLAAARGAVDDAIRYADDVIADPDTQGWDVLAAHRARGVAELAAGRCADAAATLGEVRRRCGAAGIGEPGIFPVAGDLVEALVAVGDAAAARVVLADLAERLDGNPWARITLDRGRAHLALAEGYDEAAAASLADCAVRYAAQGLRHDAARARLALGRALRRTGRRAAARSALAESEAAFVALGADGWARLAAEEQAAVSGRRTTAGLTDAENRVARLAAEGLSNREIARRLVISPHTVETHLSRAYRKLGVSARSQLVHHLA